MKLFYLRILLLLLVSIFTTTSIYSQEWIHGKGFPLWVTAIEVAEYDSSIVFIGTQNNGLWRRDFSTDEGWVEINSGYAEWDFTEEDMNNMYRWFRGDYHSVRTIETNENLPGLVFVAGNGNHVYRSIDSGDSWEEWGSPNPTVIYPVSNIEIISGVPERVIAINNDAYMNDNQNSDWTLIPVAASSEIPEANVLYINEDPHVDGRLLAGLYNFSDTCLMESLNYGENWTQLTEPDGRDMGYHTRLFFDPSDSLRIYLDYPNMSDFQAIMTTDNGGESWYSSPHPNTISYGHVRAVDNNGTLYATEGRSGSILFRSFDQLGTFYHVPMEPEVESLQIHATKYLEFIGSSETFITGGSWGLYKSDDAGETSYHIEQGINRGYIDRVEPISGSEDAYLAFSENTIFSNSGILKSDDGGRIWVRVVSDRVYDVKVSPSDPNRMLSILSNWRSVDGGNTWNPYTSFYSPVKIIWSPTNSDTLFGVGNTGIYRSSEFGENWTIIYDHSSALISNFFMHPVYYNKFWAASDSLLISSDYCESWETLATPDVVTDVFVLASDTNSVYITCENENIYKLDSNGIEWINISEDLPRESYSYLGEMKPVPGEDAFLLVVKGQGIYHFNCDSEEWILLEGDYDPRVTDVAINDFGKIIISTSSDGVFVGDYTTPVSSVDPNSKPDLPTTVFLDDPYPNPFNSSISIPFSLPNQATVEFTLFDILGREVYQSTQQYSSGSHTKVLNSESDFVSNVASGIYFVQMKSASARLTKKIMLLR